MKRILLLAIVGVLALTLQALLNCSSPLETLGSRGGPSPDQPDTIILWDTIVTTDSGAVETLLVVDTVLQIDTVATIDTTTEYDTIFVPDTIIEVDSTFLVDTLNNYDTTVVVDTVIQVDTVTIVDTVTVVDTVVAVDTVVVADTVVEVDTVVQVDTVIVTDTIIETDTVMIIDTIVDTVIVEVTDTIQTAYCANLGPQQKEIIWLFHNEMGQYRLDFRGLAEMDHPSNEVKVTVDGMEYLWDISAQSEFVIEQQLAANATVRIERTRPNPYGHGLDICVAVERM